MMDGGLIANNPAIDLLTDVHTASSLSNPVSQPAVGCLISVGTGRIPPKSVTDLDVTLPPTAAITNPGGVGGLAQLGNTLWKNVTALQNLKSMLVEQVACSDGAVVERARSWTHSMGAPYWRLTPQLVEEVALDTKDDERLVQLLWLTKCYANEGAVNELETLAAYLRVERRVK